MSRDLTVRYLGDTSNLVKSSGAAKSSLASTGAAAEKVQQRYAAAVQVSARAAKSAAASQEASARKVRIEELKLQELRATGKAKASQLAVAEDRLAKAHTGAARSQQTSEDAAKRYTAAQSAQATALKRTEAQVTKTGGGFRGFGRLVKTGLREAGAGAFDEFKSRAGRSGRESGRAFSSALGGGIRSGIGVVVGAVAVLKGLDVARDFVRSSIAEARESQQVGAKSSAIIKATGGAAKVSADQLGALTTAISNKTGVDDEAIQSGANLLLTFKRVRNEAGEGGKIFDRATAASVDLSKAGFGSVTSASKQLGKALNDPIKGTAALSKAGVQFTDAQKKQIAALVKSGDVLGAQKIILKEVEGQVGGVAAASTTAGEKLKTAFDNAKESVGTAFLPTLDAAETAIRTKLVPGIANLAPLVKSLGPSLGSIGRVASAAFGGFSDSIGNGKGAIKSLTDFVSTNQAGIVGFFTSAGHAAISFAKVAAVAVSGVLKGYVGLQKGIQATLEFILSNTQTAFATVGAGAKALGLDDLAAKAQGAVGALQTMRDNNKASDSGAGLAQSIADGIDNNLLPALGAADKALTKTGQTEAFKASQRDAAAKTAIAIRDVGTASDGSQIKIKKWSDVSKLGAAAQGDLRSNIKRAQSALRGQIDAQQAAGSGQKALTKTWQTGKKRLAEEFQQMGISRREAGKLAAKYAGVKPKVKTKFETPGLPGAKTGTDNYKGSLKDVPGRKSTKFQTPGLNDAYNRARGLDSTLRNIPKNIQIKINQAVATKGDRLAADRAQGGVWNGPDRVIKAASGRVLPGFTPGRDIHRFYSATAGELNLSGGEAIMRPEFTRAVGGAPGVDRINRDAQDGSLARRLAEGGIPALSGVPAAPSPSAPSARSATATAVMDPRMADVLAAAVREAVAGLAIELGTDSRGIMSLVDARIVEQNRKRKN